VAAAPAKLRLVERCPRRLHDLDAPGYMIATFAAVPMMTSESGRSAD